MKSANEKTGFWPFFEEWMKGRGLAKENERQTGDDREERGATVPAQADSPPQPQETQRSCKKLPPAPSPAQAMPTAGCPKALDRIRQAALKDKKLRFTNLAHHVYAIDRLRQAYFEMSKQAAPGIDGQTWSDYGRDLESNLQRLSDRLAKGSYHAPPVKRVYIPKASGKQRPIGVPTLEDKIVQRAATAVLSAVYEADFKGFSYGFRPGKSAHLALDALAVAIQTKKVNFVLDADIRSFFDTLDHKCLMQFVEHRIADRHLLRLLRKWLSAGVMEAGRRIEQAEGVPQGGSVSPLLANCYLHYALDLWADQWRTRHAKGDVIIVRYADDFVIGFEHEADAKRFLDDLRERFRKFNLELHDEKTRILPFGRSARSKDKRDKKRKGGDRQQGGGDGSGGNAAASTAAGTPPARPGGKAAATFNFLGFTHSCGQTRRGRFIVRRRTMANRMRAKLRSLKEELRTRMHQGVSTTGRWLASVLRGHVQYFGVPRNSQPLWAFRAHLTRLWKQALNRRSQRRAVTWARMSRIAKRWLAYPRIVHPYPEERLCVIIQGKSPVR
jgi:group II intron reverse transcriptase/maturase